MKEDKAVFDLNVNSSFNSLELPENDEVIYKMKKGTIIDILQIIEFSNAIQESIVNNRKVKVFEFNEINSIEHKGVITYIDMLHRKIKIEYEDGDFDWIKLDDITDIILV